MLTPQQVVTPQMNALREQMTQLEQVYNQINTANPAPSQAVTIPFVDGLKGAREFLKSLAPNSNIVVFDKDEAQFFMLSVDANRIPAPIKIGKFSLEDAPEPDDSFITHKDFEDFKNEIRSMFNSMKNNQQKQNPKPQNQPNREVKE